MAKDTHSPFEAYPDNLSGIPRCSEDPRCYDGKRCRLIGFPPCEICEPAVEELVRAVELADKFAELGTAQAWHDYLDFRRQMAFPERRQNG